jgi:hypothetical protein
MLERRVVIIQPQPQFALQTVLMVDRCNRWTAPTPAAFVTDMHFY